MNIYSLRPLPTWLIGGAFALCLSVCVGCGQTGAAQHTAATTPPTFSVPTSVTETPRPTHTMNPDYATRYALATVGAHNRELFLTAIALSPPPTRTPGRRPDAPTVTPVMGMLPGCLPFGNGAGLPYNCWQGLVNGQLLILKAGTGGYGHDETQGFVWINTPDQREDGNDIYFTPQHVGPVKIVAVDGLLFTLVPAEPNSPPVTFVFDFATRQWVTPGPSPVPSLLPTPPAPTTLEGETPHQIAGAGIIWQETSPHFTKLMHTRNQWVERENQQGNSVLVCAESKFPREDPQQGIIGVLYLEHDSGTFISGPDLYLTPLRAGAVQVIDAVGERLTLRAEDGTLFTFDIPTRQWVTPDPSPIPSLLPMP